MDYAGHYLIHHFISSRCKSLFLLCSLPPCLLGMGPVNKPYSFSFLERFCFHLSPLCYVSLVAWQMPLKDFCWRWQVLWVVKLLQRGEAVDSLKGNTMFSFLSQYSWGFCHSHPWSGSNHFSIYVLINVWCSDIIKRKCFGAIDYQLKNVYWYSSSWEISWSCLSFLGQKSNISLLNPSQNRNWEIVASDTFK